jgi:hypothetical protein
MVNYKPYIIGGIIMTNKINALANFLSVEVEEIEKGWDENTFTYDNQEYKVLTEEEANKETKAYIEESVWAFNASFILDHTNIEWNNKIEKSFQKMQSELCEDANELVKAMIEDFDEFVNDAIEADGRGHFLAGYDGQENEEDGYYIYRTN